MWALLNAAADYWWVVPLAGAALVVYRFTGWRGLVAVATIGLAGGLWTEGRRHERAKAEQAAEAKRLRSEQDRSKLDEEISKLDPASKSKRLNRWMRDDL